MQVTYKLLDSWHKVKHWKKRKKMRKVKIGETSFTHLLYFYSFIFKKKSRFHWRREKENVVIAEEELNRFNIDSIENLKGLLRFVFISEECGNLKESMMVESLLEILTKRRSQTFYNSLLMFSLSQV